MNGITTRLRIVASCLIAVLAVTMGAYLIHEIRTVPVEYWALALLATGSVAGCEVIVAFATLKNKNKENGQ
jgi:hypothetical protein